MSGGVLAEIVDATRRSVAARRAQPGAAADLERMAAAAQPEGERFRRALAQPGRIRVIAECKQRSPSRGLLAADYDPARQARTYQAGGAAAVSVLTEPTRFGGALAHLAAVRAAVALPLLRKDFIIDEYQLLEARAYGADAVLLIVRALTQRELCGLHECAEAMGMAALVEVHDEPERARALDAGARIIGVNNRDLRTLAVDLAVSVRLAALIPDGIVKVSESGIRSRADLERLQDAGFDAVLVGEQLMTAADPAAALAALTGAVRDRTAAPAPKPAQDAPPALQVGRLP